TSPIQFMFSASSCRLLVLLTMQQFFVFFATSKAPCFMVFIFRLTRLYSCKHTLMLIGLAILLIVVLLLVIVCFSGILSSPGGPRNKHSVRDRVPKLNTVLSLILLPRLSPFVGFLKI
ncbi:hypothetical protein PIB30_114672, partial [Stylosanthes scabra]|nr:hypothetical protein [Stylosanthes scabra]